MKCTDCKKYYLGCDTEVFNYGYEEDKAEECRFFLLRESLINNSNKGEMNNE